MTVAVYAPATYAANLGNLSFPIPWVYQSISHVKPYLDGVLLTTGFIVSPASNSGVVTFSTAPVGNFITFIRELPIDQPIDFQNQETFDQKRHEDAYDREVMISAQLNERLSRAIVAQVGQQGQVLPLPKESYALGWKNNILVNLPSAPVFLSLNSTSVIDLDFSYGQAIGFVSQLMLPATFVTSNKLGGRVYGLRIKDDGIARTLTWPPQWKWMTVPYPNTTIPGKILVVTIECLGSDESSLLADWKHQP